MKYAILALFLFSSCSHQAFVSSERQEKVRKYSKNDWSFFYQSKNYKLDDLCPKGKLDRVEVNRGFAESLLEVLTLGIVKNSAIIVYCSE